MNLTYTDTKQYINGWFIFKKYLTNLSELYLKYNKISLNINFSIPFYVEWLNLRLISAILVDNVDITNNKVYVNFIRTSFDKLIAESPLEYQPLLTEIASDLLILKWDGSLSHLDSVLNLMLLTKSKDLELKQIENEKIKPKEISNTSLFKKYKFDPAWAIITQYLMPELNKVYHKSISLKKELPNTPLLLINLIDSKINQYFLVHTDLDYGNLSSHIIHSIIWQAVVTTDIESEYYIVLRNILLDLSDFKLNDDYAELKEKLDSKFIKFKVKKQGT